MVSKVYPMRSHTVSAEGGAAAVIKANDSLDAHFRDTISGSDWLADQDVVEAFVNDQGLELRPGAVGQEARDGDSEGEVDTEALAAGKPVVAYDFDGADEVCQHGHSGFIVPTGDVESAT